MLQGPRHPNSPVGDVQAPKDAWYRSKRAFTEPRELAKADTTFTCMLKKEANHSMAVGFIAGTVPAPDVSV